MSSRIATKFLTLPITETSISDMVWKYSDLNVADGIYCTPSLKYLQELITLLDGPKVTEIVSQVPSPNLLDSLFSEDCKSEVVKGIVLNPYTSLSTLSKIESLKPGESLLIKETRESHNKNFSESSSFSLRILEEYIENGNLSKFFCSGC